MPYYHRLAALSALLPFFCNEVRANIDLPNIFTDNMILQQDTEVNIWGKASAGEHITVSGTWSTTSESTTADVDGNWSLKLATPVAPTDGTTFNLVITGNNQVVLYNVAIGDVWIIAGQSNVNWALNFSNVVGGPEAIATADFPSIRLLRLGDRPSSSPEDDYRINNSFPIWRVCSPSTAGPFSAAGFFFARDFYQHTQIPVGVIHTAKAGSTAQAWTPREELEQLQEYADHAPWTTTGDFDHDRLEPTVYYNGNAAPLRRMTIRGVLWYQGETNVDLDDPEIYAKTLPKLVEGWRREWDQGDFPFYFVQIVPYPDYPNDTYPDIIEAQNSVLSLPNTGIVPTIDLASTSLHPGEKREIGERLSLLARSRIYGEELVDSGPIYAGKWWEGPILHVYFHTIANGLAFEGNNHSFEIAGDDLNFFPATVVEVVNYPGTIFGEIQLKSENVPDPRHVRYAWNTFPSASLFNSAGLPLAPFRSDVPYYLPSIFDYVPQKWSIYDVIVDAFVFTSNIGWIFIPDSTPKGPWVFSFNLDKWLYIPGELPDNGSGWIYFPPE